MASMAEQTVWAIRSLSVTDHTGMMHLGNLSMYANALGVTEDEADEMIESALELMEGRGEVEVDPYGHAYDRAKAHEYETALREDEEEGVRELEAYETIVRRGF